MSQARPRPAWRAALPAAAMVVYGGVFVWYSAARGVPTERESVIAWLVGALVVFALLSPGHRFWRPVVDWLPFALALVAYDYTRGAAEALGFPLHVTPQIAADRWIGLGHVPTVWLQEHIVQEGPIHAWEVVPTLTYMSHFIVPYAIAAWLYARNRRRWFRYAGRFLSLTLVGLLTYIVLPWAPPWYAARRGLLPPLHRTVRRGWAYLPFDQASYMFDKGQATVNLTAALPSLHAAYPMLIAVFFWRTSRWWTRILLVAYPTTMAFTLVAGAEHYVVDILLGWAYAGVVHEVWRRFEARRDADQDESSPATTLTTRHDELPAGPAPPPLPAGS